MQSPADLANRRSLTQATRDLDHGVVLVASGVHVPVPGTDQYHEFHAHPEFAYQAGAQLPGAVLGFDRHDGWTLFAPVAGLEDRVWIGDGEDPERLASDTGLPVRPAAELAPWLEKRRSEAIALLGNHDLAEHPNAYAVANWHSLELEIDESLAARLSEQISEQRRAKDPSEIDLMRRAADASRAGHLYAFRNARPWWRPCWFCSS